MNKIKVIIKRPDEQYGHVSWISDTLENLQKTVDGYIEFLPLTTDVAIICNDEGKLRGLEPNMEISGDLLVGTILFVGTDGDKLCDFPLTFKEYKRVFFGEGK